MRNKKSTRSTNSRFSPTETATPASFVASEAASAPATTATRSPTHDEIAARAHAIWVEQGCPAGREVENWLEAERQLGGPAATRDSSIVDNNDPGLNERDGDGIMTTRINERLDDTADRERRASATSVNL